MNVMITGSNGQVGKELCRISEERGLEFTPLDLPEFDITDAAATDNMMAGNNFSKTRGTGTAAGRRSN